MEPLRVGPVIVTRLECGTNLRGRAVWWRKPQWSRCSRPNTCGQPPKERPLLSSGLLAAVTGGPGPSDTEPRASTLADIHPLTPSRRPVLPEMKNGSTPSFSCLCPMISAVVGGGVECPRPRKAQPLSQAE